MLWSILYNYRYRAFADSLIIIWQEDNEKMRKRIYYVMVTGVLAGLLTACGKENSLDTREVTALEIETTEITTTEMATEELSTEEKMTEEHSVPQETDSQEKGSMKEEADAGTKETSSVSMTSEEAEKLLFQTLGEKDQETGNTYSFGYVDAVTVDGTEYHMFVWSWLVEDHSSRLTDLFVAVDGTAIYEGLYNGETAEVFKEKNYLED